VDFPHPDGNVGFGPKFCGTGGKPTLPIESEIANKENRQLRASRLAVPRQSTDEALVRIAGATTIVNAANGLSLNDSIAVTN
jgi:hypothetical protein